MSNVKRKLFDTSKEITFTSNTDFNEVFKELSDQRSLTFIQFQIKRSSLNNITSSTFAKIFGKSIQNLINLQSLILIVQPYNQIDFTGYQRIGDGLKTLNKLSTFVFQICKDNPINSESIKGICEGLGCLSNLTSLSLSIESNNIQFEGAQAIGNCLKSSKNLVNLSLQILEGNHIKPAGAQEIAKGLQSLSKLQNFQFCIKDGNIGQQGAVAIGQAFNQLGKLTNLVFKLKGLNYILTEGAQAIGEGLSRLSNLKTLTFELGPENMFGGEGMNKLNQGLRSSKNLQQLSLIIDKNNYINRDAFEQLGQALNLLAKLESLVIKIEGNLIIPKALEELMEFKGLQNLKKMTLSFNDCQLKQKGAQVLASSFMSLTNLNYLNLCIEDDIIEDNGIDAISESIKCIRNLKVVSIEFSKSNNISFEAKYRLVQQIKSLIYLKSLQLIIPNRQNDNQLSQIYTKLMITKFHHTKRLVKYVLSL